MNVKTSLPLPKLDALPLGAHRHLSCEDGTNNVSDCHAEVIVEGADGDCAKTRSGESADDDCGKVLSGESAVAACEDHDGALPVLTDEALFEACGVRIAFTGREGGVSEGPYAKLNNAVHVGDDEQAVLRNRQIVLDALGVPDAQLIAPNQVHGTNVVCVGDPADTAIAASSSAASPVSSGAAELTVPVAGKVLSVSDAIEEAAQGADAIVVKIPEVAALLNYADCLSLIIVAPNGSFAVVHAGWRGAVAHIASMAALELAAQTGEDPSQFNAYIGPHIRSECFEVSVDVAEQFAAEFGASVVVGERHVSLARAVACDLESVGVSPQRIADSDICTKCNSDRYFSYRATNGRCGRHSAVAVRCT